MQLLELSDATSFLTRSSAFLLREEAANNLLLSSAMILARSSATRSTRLSFFTVQDKGATICAALNSTERRLLLSSATAEAAAFMGRELAARSLKLKGVLGPTASATSFCNAYAVESAPGLPQKLSPRFIQKIMRLETPVERPVSEGLARVAKEKDLRLCLKWSRQFVTECKLDETERETEEVVHRYIENRQLFIWENSKPVAMAGFGGQTPNGVRVNMVYTDPAHRARGYAGSIVHVLSRKLLAGGHRFCFLFTDAGDPVANRVYERLGYQAIGDFTEYRLSPIG